MGVQELRWALAVVVVGAATTGCLSPMDTDPAVEIDESAVLSAVAGYRTASQFAHVSGDAYASALGATSYIELFANTTAADSYRLIAPEVSGSGSVVPEGGVIVREVLDANGTAQRLTVMAKGPAGYNPALGDWFFAVTTLDGTPIVEDGVARSGRLADCYSCHVPRMGDDFLFGVPAIRRGGTTTTPPPPPPGQGAPVCGDFACEQGETNDTCPRDCNDTHGHGHGHHH